MKKVLFGLLALILGTSLLFTTAYAASMYKWIDEDGTVHFSQNPPPKGKFESLSTDTASQKSLSETARSTLEAVEQKQPEVTETPEMAKEKARQRLEADIAEYNCQIGQDNLQAYTEAEVIQDGEGKLKKLTEEEREAGLEKARELIEKYCP